MTEVLRQGSEVIWTSRQASYAIPRSEFKRNIFCRFGDVFSIKNKIPEKYVFSVPVTRSNFVAMVVDSFAKSRGDATVQQAYFEYLRIHMDFDYETTIRNFLNYGGYSCLSLQERLFVSNKFRKVKSHPLPAKVDLSKIFEQTWTFGRRINTELEGQIRSLHGFPRVGSFLSKEKLEKLSPDEFLETINKHFATKNHHFTEDK